MALKIYSDSNTTSLVKPSEVFENGDEVDGVNKNFQLIFLDGEDVGGVYLENRVTYSSVTFSDGVSSVLSGASFISNALVGRRVIHNGEFRGTVVENDANTITIDNVNTGSMYTSSVSSSCIISEYTKQRLTTDYSIVGNTVIFVIAPPATSRVHVVPKDDITLAFGGNPGEEVTVSGSVWVKREPGYEYRSLRAYSKDNSVDDVIITQSGVTSSGTLVSGFSGLLTNTLVGYAFWQNGAFRGVIVGNTATTLTLDRSYTNEVASDAQVFNVGPLSLCLTEDGDYEPVIVVPDITTDTPVRIYYRDTVVIPNAPTNYPNVIIKLSGIEYLA